MTSGRLAFLNLWRRPVSTFLAISSLAIAVGLGGLLLGLCRSLLDSIVRVDSSIDIIIGPKSSGLEIVLDGFYFAGSNSDLISYATLLSIKKYVDPLHIIPLVHFAQVKGTPVIGTDTSWIERPTPLASPQLAQGRWFKELGEAVLGVEAARVLDLSVGDTCVAESFPFAENESPLWRGHLTIVGLLAETGHAGDRAIYVALGNAWDFHDAAINAGKMRLSDYGDRISCLLLTLDPDRRTRQARNLHEMIHNRGGEQLIYVRDELNFLLKILGQGEVVVGAVTAFLVLLAASIACILFTERFETMKIELGMLRALGYSRSAISKTILLEGFFLAVMGVAAGMTLQWLGILIVPLLWKPPYLGVLPWLDPWIITLWAGTFLVSLLATTIPMIRLYRWNAHDSLKGM